MGREESEVGERLRESKQGDGSVRVYGPIMGDLEVREMGLLIQEKCCRQTQGQPCPFLAIRALTGFVWPCSTEGRNLQIQGAVSIQSSHQPVLDPIWC